MTKIDSENDSYIDFTNFISIWWSVNMYFTDKRATEPAILSSHFVQFRTVTCSRVHSFRSIF